MEKARQVAIVAAVVVIAGCATPTTPPAPPNPMIACVNALASDQRLVSIREKVSLSSADKQTFDMMTITSKPTDSEKQAIAVWVKARQECFDGSKSWATQYLHPALYGTGARTHSSLLVLTARLHNGELTYGEYARARAALYNEGTREWNAIAQRIEEQAAASEEADRNRAMMMLRNMPWPSTTTCNMIGRQMFCTTF